MSTNSINFNNNPINTLIILNPEPIENKDLEENSSQKAIKDFLNELSKGENLNESAHLLIIQQLFQVLILKANDKLMYDPEFHRAIFSIFDVIRRHHASPDFKTDSYKKEMESKIDAFCAILPEDTRKENENLLNHIKNTLLNAKLEDLLSSTGNFLELENPNNANIENYQSSYLILKISFASFRHIYQGLNQNIRTAISSFENVLENSLNGKKIFMYLVESLAKNFLNISEFSADELHDLLFFFSDIIDSYQTKKDEIKKSLDYYVEKIDNIFPKIEKNLFKENQSIIKNKNYKELFYYISEFKKYTTELESFKIDSELVYLIFYFFHIKTTEELKKILTENKNYTSFFRSLKAELTFLAKNVEKTFIAGKLPEHYLECFKKDPILNQFRNLTTLIIKNNSELCNFIEILYFIEHQNMELLYNELLKPAPSPSRVRKLQITAPETQEKGSIESKKPEIIEDIPSLKTSVKVDVKSGKNETAIVKQKKEQNLQQLLALNTNTLQFSGKSTKEFFDNSQTYLSNLLTLIDRFQRLSKGPISRETIPAHIVNIVVSGTLALEQIYSSIVSGKKKQFTVTHDLLQLYEQCEFSNEQPTNKDLKLLEDANKSEIISRNIAVKLVNNSNRKKEEFVKKLLEKAYLFFINNDPNNDPKKLLISSFQFCEKVIISLLSLRKFVAAPFPEENLKKVTKQLKELSNTFEQSCDNLQIIDQKPNEKLSAFEDFLKQLSDVKLSRRTQTNLDNLKFLTALHKAEFDSYSEKKPQEMTIISSRVFYLNQLILEAFLNLIIEVRGKQAQISDGDLHQLDNLLKQTGYQVKLNQREKEFLQKGKEIRHMARYEPVEFKKKSTAGTRAQQLQEIISYDCVILNSIIEKLTATQQFKKDFKKS